MTNIMTNLDPASNDFLCEICRIQMRPSCPVRMPLHSRKPASWTWALRQMASSWTLALRQMPSSWTWALRLMPSSCQNGQRSAFNNKPISLQPQRLENSRPWNTMVDFPLGNAQCPRLHPAYSKFRGVEFKDNSRDQYWGLGTICKGDNDFRKTLSAFRAHQTKTPYSLRMAPPIVPTQKTIAKPMPTPWKNTPA